jgi:hypothetical protein
MDGKPFSEATGDVDVQSIRKTIVQPTDRLTHRGSNGRWRQFTQLGDERNVINGFMRRLRKDKEGTKDCLCIHFSPKRKLECSH